MKKLFFKLFVDSNWAIAYSRIDKSYSEAITSFSSISFQKLCDSGEYWYADPLPYTDENGTFLFAEAISKKTRKGSITLFNTEKKMIDLGIIIDEPFHMSYPYVFKLNGHYYMIPETNNVHALCIYKAVKYPSEWEMVKRAFEGESIVDTDICVGSETFGNMMVLLKKNKPNDILCYYSFDDDFNFTELCRYNDDNKNMRGAGLLRAENDTLIRPTQEYGKVYGEKIHFQRICKIDGSIINERFATIEADDLNIFCGKKRIVPHKIHTYSMSDNLLFIDYFEHRINLLKPFRLAYNYLARHI